MSFGFSIRENLHRRVVQRLGKKGRGRSDMAKAQNQVHVIPKHPFSLLCAPKLSISVIAHS